MYYGYAGKILHINLSNNEIRTEELNLEQARKYIGGFGLAYKMVYDLTSKNIDPLSEDNPIIFCAGTLAGSTVPGAVKISALTKLPLTGTYGWSHGSMKFAAMLKWAGYDCLVVTGKASHPVYIKIENDDIKIHKAGKLWGQDTIKTTEEIRKGNDQASVLTIGQAGENKVRFSLAMIDNTSTLGQGGFGAVMGSKNLKAIVVYGSKGINIFDKKRFSRAIRGLKDRYMKFPKRDVVLKLGMMASWEGLLTEYFSTDHMDPEEITDIYGIPEYEKVKIKSIACPGCLVADKEVLLINSERFPNKIVPTVSYGAIAAMSAPFGIKDISEGIYIYDLCNRYGISTQTLEGFLDFIIQLNQKGIITQDDLNGIEIARDFKTTETLINMIVNRSGIGDIFAEGWQAVIERYGKGCEKYAYINKNINFIWDPRLYVLGTMEFAQITSPKGPYSAFGGSPTTVPNLNIDAFKRHCNRVGASDNKIARIFDTPDGFNVARLTSCFENWVTILSSLGICNRASNDRYYSAVLCAELYSAATGIELNVSELVMAAERTWTLARSINVREGYTRKDDIIPNNWFETKKTFDKKEHNLQDYFKKHRLKREDIVQLLDDYYVERGWDIKTGRPKKDTLSRLGIVVQHSSG